MTKQEQLHKGRTDSVAHMNPLHMRFRQMFAGMHAALPRKHLPLFHLRFLFLYSSYEADCRI